MEGGALSSLLAVIVTAAVDWRRKALLLEKIKAAMIWEMDDII